MACPHAGQRVVPGAIGAAQKTQNPRVLELVAGGDPDGDEGNEGAVGAVPAGGEEPPTVRRPRGEYITPNPTNIQIRSP